MKVTDVALLVGIIADITIVVSLLQIHYTAKNLKLEAFLEIKRIFKDNQKIFDRIYEFPVEMLCSSEQFYNNPPKRHRNTKHTEGERRRCELRDEQKTAVSMLSEEQIKCAKKCIDALNDVTALIESRFISYDDVLSMYHTLILRLVYVIEPVRKQIESDNLNSIGGNYGNRLLRLRHQAFHYNRMHPKHRDVSIRIVMYNDGIEYSRAIIPALTGNVIFRFTISLISQVKYAKVKFFY